MGWNTKYSESVVVAAKLAPGTPALLNSEISEGEPWDRVRRSYLLFDTSKVEPEEVTAYAVGDEIEDFEATGTFVVNDRRVSCVGDHLFLISMGAFGRRGYTFIPDPLPGTFTFPVFDESRNESESGWDSMTTKAIVKASSAADVYKATRGSNWSGNMYVTGNNVRRVSKGVYEVSVNTQGILSASGQKVTYSSAPVTQSGFRVPVGGAFLLDQAGDPTSPGLPPPEAPTQDTNDDGVIDENDQSPGAFFDSLKTLQPVPTIEIEEIFVGDVRTQIEEVGKQNDPPASVIPEDPTSVWSYLNAYAFNIPNGWVKMHVGAQGLRGVTGIWLVRTRWQWIHAREPR